MRDRLHERRIGDEGALLRCLIGGRVEPRFGRRSDRPGELGERCGHALGRRGVESEFVVAASEILDEGMSGDDHLRSPIGS
jgi:hypothetical protein